MTDRELALEQARNVQPDLLNLQNRIADAILEARAREAERPSYYFDARAAKLRAAELRAQKGEKA